MSLLGSPWQQSLAVLGHFEGGGGSKMSREKWDWSPSSSTQAIQTWYGNQWRLNCCSLEHSLLLQPPIACSLPPWLLLILHHLLLYEVCKLPLCFYWLGNLALMGTALGLGLLHPFHPLAFYIMYSTHCPVDWRFVIVHQSYMARYIPTIKLWLLVLYMAFIWHQR